MDCKICKGRLIKKEIIYSGNAKYVKYVCNGCGNVVHVCEGLKKETKK